jgi:hypothetical protein
MFPEEAIDPIGNYRSPTGVTPMAIRVLAKGGKESNRESYLDFDEDRMYTQIRRICEIVGHEGYRVYGRRHRYLSLTNFIRLRGLRHLIMGLPTPMVFYFVKKAINRNDTVDMTAEDLVEAGLLLFFDGTFGELKDMGLSGIRFFLSIRGRNYTHRNRFDPDAMAARRYWSAFHRDRIRRGLTMPGDSDEE